MTLLIKVENNATALTNGSATILGASMTGYWALDGANHIEVDAGGKIEEVTLAGADTLTSTLATTTRFAATSVESVKVGYLTKGGDFAAYISS